MNLTAALYLAVVHTCLCAVQVGRNVGEAMAGELGFSFVRRSASSSLVHGQNTGSESLYKQTVLPAIEIARGLIRKALKNSYFAGLAQW